MKELSFRAVVVVAAMLGTSTMASAQFSGYYAPANWTEGHVAISNPSEIDAGTVFTGGAPASITVIGSDETVGGPPGVDTYVHFSILMPAAGTVSFNWSYTTTDTDPSAVHVNDPFWDPAGVVVNGDLAPHQLSFGCGNIDPSCIVSATESGSYSLAVASGDVVGFYVRTVDNYAGNASLTITDFSGPLAAVPEPASAAMLALGVLGLAGVAAARRRRSA
jgi:hypothetical protein